MIPKIIHYCWFGRGQMPELGVKCIESWKKFLPDYQLMLWNEDSFDVNQLRFTREAYAQKRYAFVTDYVRLWALNTYGGVYMDTDVEIIRNIDSFLKLPAFSGFESNDLIPTGIMASIPQARWLQPLLAYYDKKPFVRWNGRLNRTPNTLIISRIFNKRGIRLDNSYQVWGKRTAPLSSGLFLSQVVPYGQDRMYRQYLLHPPLRRFMDRSCTTEPAAVRSDPEMFQTALLLTGHKKAVEKLVINPKKLHLCNLIQRLPL